MKGKAAEYAPWALLAMALLVTALASNLFLFNQEIQASTHFTLGIMPRLGAWAAQEEGEVSRAEVRGLETSDILRRYYRKGGYEVETVIAYIPVSSRKSAHAQESCLRGNGALVNSVAKVRHGDLGLTATAIEMDHAGRKASVLYWYKFGSRHTSDYIRSVIAMTLGKPASSSPGSSLIRLLTMHGPDESAEQAQARLREFAAVLIPELNSKLP